MGDICGITQKQGGLHFLWDWLRVQGDGSNHLPAHFSTVSSPSQQSIFPVLQLFTSLSHLCAAAVPQTKQFAPRSSILMFRKKASVWIQSRCLTVSPWFCRFRFFPSSSSEMIEELLSDCWQKGVCSFYEMLRFLCSSLFSLARFFGCFSCFCLEWLVSTAPNLWPLPFNHSKKLPSFLLLGSKSGASKGYSEGTKNKYFVKIFVSYSAYCRWALWIKPALTSTNAVDVIYPSLSKVFYWFLMES